MFSIITATYNRAYCVSNAIQSVLSQEFKDWELIIIDDGSTDNTPEIARRFSDSRIKYIYFSENKGCNAARNHGIQMASKEWITFLDSDNVLVENALQIMADKIKEKKFPFLCFLCKDKRGRYTVTEPLFDGFRDYKNILSRGGFEGEYYNVVKTRVLRQCSFPEDIVGGEGITWLLIIKDLGKVFFVPEVVLIYNNELPDRLSNVWRNVSRICGVYKKEIEVLGGEYRQYYPFQYVKKRMKYGLYYAVSGILRMFS